MVPSEGASSGPQSRIRIIHAVHGILIHSNRCCEEPVLRFAFPRPFLCFPALCTFNVLDQEELNHRKTNAEQMSAM